MNHWGWLCGIGWKWLFLALATFGLAVAVMVLGRLRMTQSRPLTACVVLSLVAHGLLFLAIRFTHWLDAPQIPRGSPLCVRLIAAPEITYQPETTGIDANDAPDQVMAEDKEPEEATLAEVPSASDIDKPKDESPALEAPPLLAALPETPPKELPDLATRSPEEMASSEPLDAEPTPVTPEIESPVADDQGDDTDDTEIVAMLPMEPLAVNSRPEIDSPAPHTTENLDAGEASDDSDWTPVAALPGSVPTPAAAATPGSDSPGASGQEGPLAHRAPAMRHDLLGAFGGSERTEVAVHDALTWLARSQAHDGRWNAQEHGAGRGELVLGQPRQGIGLRADSGVTGLALLAFLGSGHGPQEGPFGQTVREGLDFLIKSPSPSGSLAGDADVYARTYCHGIATLAVGEAYALTRDPKLRTPLQRALAYSQSTQHPRTGGWRYHPGDSGDMSQFGWQVMALFSGRNSGRAIPPRTAQGMRTFLQSVSSGRYSGLASYRPYEASSPVMTGEALVCRLLLGDIRQETVDEAVRNLLDSPPGREPFNVYYDYYGSLALHLAGASWEPWNLAMQQELLPLQETQGPQAGSWDPDPVWGRCGGRVYSTAMSALCLEVYYRYLPLLDHAIAQRQSAQTR